jgi:N-acetylmuramoyl-L-alanine amidase
MLFLLLKLCISAQGIQKVLYMKVLHTAFRLMIVSGLLFMSGSPHMYANKNDSYETAVVNGIIKFDIQRLTGIGELDKIVIDAGHGGKDHGCSGAHSKEKFIVLDIAKKLGKLLRSYHPEIEVIFTRETDVFIPLDTRIQLANKNKADLFISIHANYIGKPHVNGTETYVMGLHRAEDNLAVAKRENSSILYESDYQSTYGGYDPNSPEAHILLSMFQNAYLDKSINFATKVEESFTTRTILKSRGVKQAGFLVLRKATMPSTLIETGFLSSRNDEAYLMSSNGQDEVANAILKAITEYKREINGEYWNEKNNSIAVVKEPVTKTSEQQVVAQDYSTRTGKSIPTTPSTQITENQEVTFTKSSSNGHPKTASGATGIPNQSNIDLGVSNTAIQAVGHNNTSSQGHPKTDSGATGIPDQSTAIYVDSKPVVQANKTSIQMASTASTVHTGATSGNAKVYRVQIGAGKNKLLVKNSKFEEITDLEIRKENDMYKYVAGFYSSLDEAFEAKKQFIDKGFKGSFIVAYQGDQRTAL